MQYSVKVLSLRSVYSWFGDRALTLLLSCLCQRGVQSSLGPMLFCLVVLSVVFGSRQFDLVWFQFCVMFLTFMLRVFVFCRECNQFYSARSKLDLNLGLRRQRLTARISCYRTS